MEYNIIKKTTNCHEHTFNGTLIALHQDGRYTNIVDDVDTVTLVNIYRNSHTQASPCDISVKSIDTNGYISNSIVPFTLFTNSPREDPRISIINNKLYISYNRIIYGNTSNTHIPTIKTVNVLYSVADTLLSKEETTENTDIYLPLKNNTTDKWEKNWLFFEHNKSAYIIYSLQPLVVINVATLQEVKRQYWDYDIPVPRKSPSNTPMFKYNMRWYDVLSNPITEKSFSIRGGAPPVFYENKYYLFAHTREMPEVRYRIVLIVLDEHLNIHAYTEPLNIDKYKIIYPAGAILCLKTKKWYVSCGVDDKDQILVKLPHEFLLSKLKYVDSV